MATLQKIRNQAGLLVAIIIGMALIAFILGDILRSGGSLLQSRQMEIAKIKGNSVSYKEFEGRVNELAEIYKMNSNSSSLDQKMSEQVREEVWQNLLREYIMGDVYDELGVAVSSDELFEMVQGANLHPTIQNIFRNPQTGQVNRPAIIQFLKHLNEATEAQRSYWIYVEDQITNERASAKYNNLLIKGLYATSWEAKANLDNKNTKREVKFVGKSYYDIPDSVISYTDKDLKNYYNSHISEYQQKKTRRIAYVVFPVEPSRDDHDNAKKWVSELKKEFSEVEDVVAFVNMNSDVRFDETYYKKSGLSDEMKSFAFNGREGDVKGPYKESGSWKITRIHKFENLPDSVKARHILLSVNSQEELVAQQALADSLVGLLKGGADFSELAKEHSQDPGSGAKGGDLGWFKRDAMVKPFNDAAFFGKVKEIQTVNSQFGIHILEVLKRGMLAKNVQLATIERKIEPSSVTYQNAYAKASKFAGENRDYESFEKAATEQGLNKQVITVSEDSKKIGGIDNSRIIVRSAYSNTKVGELVMGYDGSPIFEIGDQYIVAALANATEEGTMAYESVIPRVELAVKKEKKAEYLAGQMSGKESLSVLAAQLKTEVKEASDLNFESFSVPGIGAEPSVVGVLSTLEENELSSPVKGVNGVYVIKVVKLDKAEDGDITANQKALNSMLGYRANYETYETLRKVADIVDKRSSFY